MGGFYGGNERMRELKEMSRLIDEYLARLRTQLPSRHRERILTEIRDHLESKADAFRAGGVPDDEAAERALALFGNTDQVVEAFAREQANTRGSLSLEDLMETLWKVTSISLATATALAAVAVAGHTMVDGEGATWWIGVKLVAATIIAACGWLTWRRASAPILEMPLLAAALLTLILGAAGSVWTIHLGLATGDFEFWALGINLLLIGQAVTTVLWLWGERVPQTA